MKKTKIILGISSFIVIGTVVAIILNRRRKNNLINEINLILDGEKASPQEGGGTVIPKTDYDKLPNGNFPLKYADKNKKVYALQKALKSRYGAKVDLDGRFGAGTYSALCDKYFSFCPPVIETIGLTATRREVSQANFDEITSKTSSTT